MYGEQLFKCAIKQSPSAQIVCGRLNDCVCVCVSGSLYGPGIRLQEAQSSFRSVNVSDQLRGRVGGESEALMREVQWTREGGGGNDLTLSRQVRDERWEERRRTNYNSTRINAVAEDIAVDG